MNNEENKNKAIKNSEDFVTKLATLDSSQINPNFDLILDEEQSTIEEYEKTILDFLKNNVDFENYSEEKKSELFDKVFSIHSEMKTKIKNAKCHFNMTGIEFKTISNRLHQNVEYTSETIFYGLNLKHTFLNDLPKITSEFDTHEHTITFSQGVILHHLLSTLKMKGLNKESYALANVLYHLSEISKIYQHYDRMSEVLNKSIMEWNMELSKDEADQLKKDVLTRLAKDEITEHNKAVTTTENGKT